MIDGEAGMVGNDCGITQSEYSWLKSTRMQLLVSQNLTALSVKIMVSEENRPAGSFLKGYEEWVFLLNIDSSEINLFDLYWHLINFCYPEPACLIRLQRELCSTLDPGFNPHQCLCSCVLLCGSKTAWLPCWLWNPGQMSPEVENRGISDSTKMTNVLQIIF